MADKFKACSIERCNGNAHYTAGGVKGWCRAHYRRYYRYADPTAGQTYKGEPLQALNDAMAHTDSECLFWTYARDQHGYGQISFEGRVQYTHRLICETLYGPPSEVGLQAAHSCGNGHLGCVSPQHIRWATVIENATDKEIHGTLPRGERHHGSLLTETQVREIRQLRGKMTQLEIGEIYGVHKETVGCVQRRENWGWLE